MDSCASSHAQHAHLPCPTGEALLRAGLLYLPDLDIYLAKVGGRAVKGSEGPGWLVCLAAVWSADNSMP